MVTIQAGCDTRIPLFCVHAEAGDVSLYYGLARYLACEQPVLGLQATSSGVLDPRPRFEEMAESHLRAIAKTQPLGPYLILGECTRGALAFEIARQLRTSEEQVRLLALVDAFPCGHPRPVAWLPSDLYRILHRIRILGLHVHNLVVLEMDDKLSYAASKARRARDALIARIAPPGHRSAGARARRTAFGQALADHDPSPCAGTAVLFRAACLPFGVRRPPDLGWGGLVTELDVVEIPGYFTTLISYPRVRMLAARLSQRLDRS